MRCVDAAEAPDAECAGADGILTTPCAKFWRDLAGGTILLCVSSRDTSSTSSGVSARGTLTMTSTGRSAEVDVCCWCRWERPPVLGGSSWPPCPVPVAAAAPPTCGASTSRSAEEATATEAWSRSISALASRYLRMAWSRSAFVSSSSFRTTASSARSSSFCCMASSVWRSCSSTDCWSLAIFSAVGGSKAAPGTTCAQRLPPAPFVALDTSAPPGGMLKPPPQPAAPRTAVCVGTGWAESC
mmetsp:Transcript_66450/g.167491  ORF Transcript_66450/g.167491 Transcript_66450/m.167491 type:complete len:242 (-) Transcript_66450:553-1278(-)